jgi:putative ABC transport system substrate-binding protein
MPKLLELLLELVPRARAIALLVNPDDPSTERVIGHMKEAVRAKRVDLLILKARTESETDAAFATVVQVQADGLILAPIAFRPHIAALALRHRIPVIAGQRDFPTVGGLLSYGVTSIYHLKGIYAGKILKGAKPPISPCSSRPNSSWSSTSRPPRRSVSPCRSRCWPAPTR